jgi:thiol-disulfide isomerase/thioredoxin
MRRNVIRGWPLVLVLLALGVSQAPAQDKVEVTVVKHAGLVEVIKGLKGKVVVVDFWSDTCIPCKKNFPHLVEMHHRYAKDGFTAVSVSVDDPNDKEVRQRVETFLRDRKATFPNYILDEKPEVWQQKLKFETLPTVFVFDRAGKGRKFTGEFEYADVEKYAAELVKTK